MLLRSAGALLGGVALTCAYEPVGLAVLLPVGVGFFLASVVGLGGRRAAWVGLVFGVTHFFSLLYWMRAVGTDAWIALSAAEAAFMVPLAVVVALVARLRWWPVWVTAAWVAVETVRGAWPFSGMPWGRLSFAVAGTPWADALVWFGFTGVSLLICGTAAWAVWCLRDGRKHRRTALATGLVLAATTLLPSVVGFVLPETGTARIATVQGDVPGSGDDLLAVHREVTASHVALTEQLGAEIEAGDTAPVDAVLWPENSTAVDPFTDPRTRLGIESAVEAVDAPVLVGAMVDAPGPDHVLNQGVVWSPGTGGGDRYSKRHPVPFGEYIPWRDTVFTRPFGKLRMIPRDMLSGTRLTPLRLGDLRIADAICFDVAYDDGIHAQVLRGADLVTVQTSNAMFINTHQIEQQFEISRLRAQETGRWVVVAAVNGVSGVVAPDGTVVSRAGTRTRQVLVDEVGLVSRVTPAVRLGAWPGRLSILVTVLALAGALLARRRAARSAARPHPAPTTVGDAPHRDGTEPPGQHDEGTT